MANEEYGAKLTKKYPHILKHLNSIKTGKVSVSQFSSLFEYPFSKQYVSKIYHNYFGEGVKVDVNQDCKPTEETVDVNQDCKPIEETLEGVNQRLSTIEQRVDKLYKRQTPTEIDEIKSNVEWLLEEVDKITKFLKGNSNY